ncbi:inorganic phosphate transporter [Haloparvum sedimenti]|uniref:inorganic phosphate transporter n=1 Tax=Haloparvum sedimenti TaxID=1678448 RepID=UPI0031B57BA1
MSSITSSASSNSESLRLTAIQHSRFIGLGMLFANLYGVPVSTSMTAVGAIAGLGLATGQLDYAVIGSIMVWWVIAPVVGFWFGAVIGRYLYPYLDQKFALEQSSGPLLTLDRSGVVPMPELGPGTTPREVVSTSVVLVIACYMSFSAGASNVANAVAPLVGGGLIGVENAVILGTVAIGLGAFTIARRTMESVGNDLTDLPLLAATIVMVVAASITTVASYIGIPMSLALSTVMCIVGLGWGRATRPTGATDLMKGNVEGKISVGAVTAETDDKIAPVGQENPENVQDVEQLFDPSSVVRFVAFWIIGPSIATALSYVTFVLLPIAGTP